jgi:hypothetical protein
MVTLNLAGFLLWQGGWFGDGKPVFEGSAATKWLHHTSLFREAKPIALQ